MKKAVYVIFVLAVASSLAACSLLPTPIPTATLAPSATMEPSNTPEPPTATAEPTATEPPTETPTPLYPPEGIGPKGYPYEVNPLTGLKVEDPEILNRRPILIKVENLPRKDRPQYGLSLADIVYEYYTEQGTTRFAALYYGKDAEMVMPIRSARFIDMNFVRMYKAVFVFGSAYYLLYQRLFNSDFSNRLIIEYRDACPAVCRFDPGGKDFLYANTAALQDYLARRGIDNSRQNLDGMFFKLESPEGGQPAEQVFTRFSGAIYNRWDYDPASGKYLRFADTENDLSGTNPQYAQLTDELTKQPIAVDNLVVIFVRHSRIDPRADVEVLDAPMLGTGQAYLARDGKIYPVLWSRMAEDQVLTLIDENGNPFPFKPGQTWVEVFTINSTAAQEGNAWRFQFFKDW
jgi:hypothetical protein